MKNNMDNLRPNSRGDIIVTQILFLLRFIQLGSIVLSGFIAIHFVYWHDIFKEPVPTGEIIYITACSIAFLENYIISALSQARQDTRPNYLLLLRTSFPSSIAMAIGYYQLRQVPFIRAWCEGDNNFLANMTYHVDVFGRVFAGNSRAVEEHMCALTCVIIVAGFVALSFTMFISVFALIGVVNGRAIKNVKLEDLDEEYSDALLPGIEKSEKL